MFCGHANIRMNEWVQLNSNNSNNNNNYNYYNIANIIANVADIKAQLFLFDKNQKKKTTTK